MFTIKQLFIKLLVMLVTGSQKEKIGHLINNYKKYNWKMFLIDLVVAGVVSVFVGLWLRSWSIPLLIVFMVCGMVGVLSKEGIRFVRKKLINMEIKGGV